MATKKQNSLEESKMTDANICKVIRMLEATDEGEKPWTKKECCQFLGMAYNTTRLASVISEYKERKQKESERRAAKRGTPTTPDEVSYVIQDYLSGETIDSISKALYRSTAVIKGILERHAVPLRSQKQDYFKPELLPEPSMREEFLVGELVYSARYGSIARVEAEVPSKGDHGKVYRIWLKDERWKQYAFQEACELASLEHLRELGVKL